MSDVKELDDWLNAAGEKVQRNVKIVTPEKIGHGYMVHVSIDTNLRELVPRVGDRQSPNEDRTIPRICVSPSLLAAFMGEGNAESRFVSNPPGKKSELECTYKGGWKIYTVPFKAALKPTGKLVWDARMTEEHWLVPYNKATASYTFEAAGKAFVHSLTLVGRNKKLPEGELTLYLEVTRENGLAFGKNVLLPKGCWQIEGPVFRHVGTPDEDKRYKVKEISRADYTAAKNQTAALLGIEDPAPAYLSW